MIITIRKSKTIQFSERKLLIPVSRLKNTFLCAVFWAEKHFAEVEAHDSSPAFLVPTRLSYSAIPYDKLQSTIKIVSLMEDSINHYFPAIRSVEVAQLSFIYKVPQ